MFLLAMFNTTSGVSGRHLKMYVNWFVFYILYIVIIRIGYISIRIEMERLVLNHWLVKIVFIIFKISSFCP